MTDDIAARHARYADSAIRAILDEIGDDRLHQSVAQVFGRER